MHQVHRVFTRHLQGDLHHVLRAKSHPGGAVGLVQMTTGGQWGAAIEDPDVVQPEESALKHVATVEVLAVEPPHEVLHHLLEGLLEEPPVPHTGSPLLYLVHEVGGPGVYRWVDVA